MRRRIIVLSVAVLAAMVLLLPLASPASAAVFRRSVVTYNGSTTALQLYESGEGTIRTMSSITSGIQLPSSYRGFCASSRVLVDGVVRLSAGTTCDTNYNAHLTFWFGTLSAYPGDRVSVWFSDPVSRYSVTHPTIIL